MFLSADIRAQKKQAGPVIWSVAGALPACDGQPIPLGVAGPVAGIYQQVLIVAGGCNFPDSMPWKGGKKKYYSAAYIFFKDERNRLQLQQTATLNNSIAYAACCSTNDGIIAAGGENENGISKKVVLIQWDSVMHSIIIKELPDLPVALTNAAATAVKSRVYLAGGETTTGVSDKMFCIDLDNAAAGWKELQPIPKSVSHTLLLALPGKEMNSIFLIGGRKKNNNGISELYSSVYEFLPGKNKWVAKAPLPFALSAGTGVALPGGTIILFGGDKGETFHKTEKLIAAISAATDSLQKDALNKQKVQIQTHHPGFSNQILTYNTFTGKTNMTGTIPFATPVTTTAFHWGDVVVIPCGEIKAGVRTPHLLTGKLNFKMP